MGIKPIDIVDDISQEDFREKYLKPCKPVVIKNMARKWPAYQKWTMEYMKEVVGDVVPFMTVPKQILQLLLILRLPKCLLANM
jgi:hypothetical protein